MVFGNDLYCPRCGVRSDRRGFSSAAASCPALVLKPVADETQTGASPETAEREQHLRSRGPLGSVPFRRATVMGRIKACMVVMLAVSASGMMGVAAAPACSPSEEASTWQRQNEVRLRKMHLVRPDLIPYPTYQAFYA